MGRCMGETHTLLHVLASRCGEGTADIQLRHTAGGKKKKD